MLEHVYISIGVLAAVLAAFAVTYALMRKTDVRRRVSGVYLCSRKFYTRLLLGLAAFFYACSTAGSIACFVCNELAGGYACLGICGFFAVTLMFGYLIENFAFVKVEDDGFIFARKYRKAVCYKYSDIAYYKSVYLYAMQIYVFYDKHGVTMMYLENTFDSIAPLMDKLVENGAIVAAADFPSRQIKKSPAYIIANRPKQARLIRTLLIVLGVIFLIFGGAMFGAAGYSANIKFENYRVSGVVQDCEYRGEPDVTSIVIKLENDEREYLIGSDELDAASPELKRKIIYNGDEITFLVGYDSYDRKRGVTVCNVSQVEIYGTVYMRAEDSEKTYRTNEKIAIGVGAGCVAACIASCAVGIAYVAYVKKHPVPKKFKTQA